MHLYSLASKVANASTFFPSYLETVLTKVIQIILLL